ncbi:DNA polymerase III subunit alpha [Lacticaseibacillus parakribbianus]|uniref:DNA polymerase III subunit alpha n=1 Tax=Lacticaseibacillus parakribbianus TaxID=2970927 RepID=UPI0021CB7A9E|nr:DNA polymerase III subunit alpha [Lacticaseibacillus parakribbianus]
MMFTHIQVQSSFTLLNGPLTVKEIVATAQERGFSAVALTDVNVMYGVVDFYRQAQAAKLKPLLGMRLELPDAQAVLIAETTAGYHQLLRLSSAIKLAQTPPNLAALPELTGIAAIVPGSYLQSEAFQALKQPATAVFDALLTKRPASLYLGLEPNQLDSELPAFAQAHDLQPLALSRVCYKDPTDAFTQKVMQAIGAGTQLNFRDPTLQDAGGDWLMPPAMAAAPFEAAGQQQALANLAALVDRADATIAFREPQLPHYPVPGGQPAAAYLRRLATAGLAKRFATAVPDDYRKRLDYELGVISEMGFDDYFLVVWDVMNHAHEVGIMTGPGRGSAAGALVAYALAITEVDPIEYNLLFERFLNPARANMPDIDLDIPDNRRGELIRYVHDRYGQDHMAQIITFGTFGAKQALRDVARVFGLSQFDANKWSAAIPNQFHIDLKAAYQQSLPLRNLVADADQNRLLFTTALALEGLPRHDSTHAAGIVLAEEPLTDTVALQDGGDGIAQTQVPMGDVEALGLLKMDFLGLRNLTLLANATKTIQQLTGKPFDPKAIPLDDQETLRLFARGDTSGVFQFESNGIRAVLRRMRPSRFEDVIATNALYRPGPMEQIDTYIARKNGQQPITYPAAALAPILAPTYGVLVYQEQVMQVASVMGGLSLGEADLLRRAMSKKKQAVIEAERVKFMAGARQKGYEEMVAQTVYAYIERFAQYGFNRSHSVAYSKIAFWLAYIKVHYPTAFYAALMNANLANTGKLRQYVQELKSRKVPVLGPDINRSGRVFRLEGHGLRFGLLSLQGVRRDLVDAILEARGAKPFADLRDLMQRLDSKWLRPETFTPFVQAGAFDGFDANRAQVQANLGELIDSVRLAGNDVGLFAALAPKLVRVPEMPATERLDQEAAVLGVYLSGHPVDRYVQALAPFVALTPAAALEAEQSVAVVLVVRRIKRIRTKKGQEMAFIDGQDGSGTLSVTVFPKLYPTIATLEANTVVLVRGRTEARDGIALLASAIEPAAAAVAATPRQRLFLRLAPTLDQDAKQALLKMLTSSRGQVPVITVSAATRDSVMLDRRYWVTPDADLLAGVEGLIGAGNAVLQDVKRH